MTEGEKEAESTEAAPAPAPVVKTPKKTRVVNEDDWSVDTSEAAVSGFKVLCQIHTRGTHSPAVALSTAGIYVLATQNALLTQICIM